MIVSVAVKWLWCIDDTATPCAVFDDENIDDVNEAPKTAEAAKDIATFVYLSKRNNSYVNSWIQVNSRQKQTNSSQTKADSRHKKITYKLMH